MGDDEMGSIVSRDCNFKSNNEFFGLKNSAFRGCWKDFCSLSFDKEILRIMCDVNYAHELPDTVDHIVGAPSWSDSKQLGDHLISLLRCPEDFDFTLRVGNREIYCHNVILTARSSYFRGLLLSGMIESLSNSVTMTEA